MCQLRNFGLMTENSKHWLWQSRRCILIQQLIGIVRVLSVHLSASLSSMLAFTLSFYAKARCKIFWVSGKAEMEHLSNRAPRESWSSSGLMLPRVHVQNWIVMDAQEGISSLIGQVWGTLYRPIWATIWEWKSDRDPGKSGSLQPGKDVILGRKNTAVLRFVALF